MGSARVRGSAGEDARLPLADRDPELRILEEATDDAAAGVGSLTIVEGPAGVGKSRLLIEATRFAADRGVPVLTARAGRLERGFSFGLAIQLLEALWASADSDERAGLAAGPAHVAASLLEGRLERIPEGEDEAYRVIHALTWFVRNVISSNAARRGTTALTVVVDDAQWGDPASLRFLAYLAARLTELPLAIVIAWRPGDELTDDAAVIALRQTAGRRLLRPGRLTRSGVERAVKQRFPDAREEVVSACSRLTRGHPFLLGELLSEIQRVRLPVELASGDRIARLLPQTIVDAVGAEVAAMPEADRALAHASAVLGESVALSDAARVADLDLETASAAADSLAAQRMLEPGMPLTFVQPLVRVAVLDSMPDATRALVHRRAAEILREDGAAAETVARHLLAAPAEKDPDAIGALRIAAHENLREGDAGGAARFLARALEEQPPENLYRELIAELGNAEAVAGFPKAAERLQHAIALAPDPGRRAELSLLLGRVLLSDHRYDEAAAVFDGGLCELHEDMRRSPPHGQGDRSTRPRLADQLDAGYVSAAALVPELAPEARRRRRRMLEELTERPDAYQRAALAHSVVQDSLHGDSRADVRALTDIAWADGAFLNTEGAGEPSLSCLTGALLFVDELERALEICETARAHAETPAASLPPAVVAHFRAWPLYERGEIDAAMAQAGAALDAPDDFHTLIRTAYATVACCRLVRGELEQAEKALAIVEDGEIQTTMRYPVLLDVRAQLRLAQHRPEAALDDALHAGRLLEDDFGVVNPGAVAWRSTAALAEIALGHASRAEELAGEELERAQRIGVTRVAIRDLRVLGLAAGGKAGIELLQQAVALADSSPQRLESMHAVLDLGAALRRGKKRAAARDPLRRALELGERHGVKLIADRARTELAAGGARSRALLLSGVEALTPSERRVAKLAAQGMTTRMIAESLFITRKTVEYHLRHIYQKLDVGSRTELAAVLDRELRTP